MAHNSVPPAELPNLLRSVHDALLSLGVSAPAEVSAEPLNPAVFIKRLVTDEFIISLEDGRKFKAMKRYLAGLGMTPDEYRAKWGLPKDYPMVAPSYAAKRSELAKSFGLGRKASASAPEAVEEIAPAAEEVPETAVPAPKRGRRKAA